MYVCTYMGTMYIHGDYVHTWGLCTYVHGDYVHGDYVLSYKHVRMMISSVLAITV